METLQSVWYFFQNEILGMAWAQPSDDRPGGEAGVWTRGAGWAEACSSSSTDTVKIMVLLGCLIFLISYIQSFFPPERTRRILGRFHGLGANCLAATLDRVCFLLLLLHPPVHGLHRRRAAPGGHLTPFSSPLPWWTWAAWCC